jgi:hypothetical protein
VKINGEMRYLWRAVDHEEVAEWSKAHAWKVCRRVTVSRVRILSLRHKVTVRTGKTLKNIGNIL